MTAQAVWWILLLVLTAGFVWEQYLDLLNAKRFDAPLPPEVDDVFDAEEYRRSMDYKKTYYRFGLWKSLMWFVLVAAALLTGFFGRLDAWLTRYVQDDFWRAMAYFAVLYVLQWVISLPWEVYATFRIEEKFGFNRRTPGLFAADQIKSFLLGLVLGGLILGAVVWFYERTGPYFWLWAWGVISGFSLLISMFFTDLILPLFNKLTPLPPGELRDKLEALATETGFRLRDIYVIDGSKRSSKANAFFSGIGPRKRIVLYDTLVDEMTSDEITAVLGHEIGHYRHGHVRKQLLLSVLTTGVMLFLFSLVVDRPEVAGALGAAAPSFQIGLTAFALLYGPVSELTAWFTNSLSRHFEFQADAFAARYGYAGSLTSALKKLAGKHLSNLTPHPLYVRFRYSHPPLAERIKHLKKQEK